MAKGLLFPNGHRRRVDKGNVGGLSASGRHWNDPAGLTRANYPHSARVDLWMEPEGVDGPLGVSRQQVEVAVIPGATDAGRITDSPLVVTQKSDVGRNKS